MDNIGGKMEIEVGEYIRTESGIIEKIKTFDEQTNIFKDEKGKLQKWLGETVFGDPYSEEITKHSKNIIDLIEVDDYINGERVTYITKTKIGRTQIITEDSTDFFLKYEYIESILTHEQYEQNCYKLKEQK